MNHSEIEIADVVIDKVRAAIMQSLFEYNFIPENVDDDEDYDMEVIRLYRGLFKEVVSEKLFDMIDEKIQSKLRKFNK